MEFKCLGCGKSHNQVRHMIMLEIDTYKGICDSCVAIAVRKIAAKERQNRVITKEPILKVV